MIRVTNAIVLEDRHIHERFVRASGPGGQNVNKLATAVELRFDVKASSLPPQVKTRLTTLAAGRVTRDGILLIDSREHRTQARNREAARARLVALVRRAAKPPGTRRPTKPSATVRKHRLESKKRRGLVKQSRTEPSKIED